MTVRGILFFTLFYGFSFGCFGYEVDQLTGRNLPLADSTKILDQEIRDRMQIAVSKAEEKCNSSDPEVRESSRIDVFTRLRDQLATTNVIGQIETFAKTNPKVKKRKIELDNSIYKDVGHLPNMMKVWGVGVSPVISVNQTQIGTDKLGHFFDQGYKEYFIEHKTVDEKNKYKFGIERQKEDEAGLFGLRTTGVYSYADVSAGYGGQKFWENMCGYRSDPKKPGEAEFMKTYRCKENAYIRCDISTGKWILNSQRQFTFKDYVTPAWDEGINCSLYRSDMAAFIFTQMNRRAYMTKTNPHQPCPVDPKKCLDFQKLYPSYVASRITSPICKKIIDATPIKDGGEGGDPISPNETFNYDYEYNQTIRQSEQTSGQRSNSDPVQKKKESPHRTKSANQ